MGEGGEMNPNPKIGHLTWPGLMPGGTARAAQAKEEGLSREPRDAAAPPLVEAPQAAGPFNPAPMGGPLASTVAYLGEQLQGAGSSGRGEGAGAGSNDHGSNQGPGSGQGSNEEARRGGQEEGRVNQGSEGNGGAEHQLAPSTSRAKN